MNTYIVYICRASIICLYPTFTRCIYNKYVLIHSVHIHTHNKYNEMLENILTYLISTTLYTYTTQRARHGAKSNNQRGCIYTSWHSLSLSLQSLNSSFFFTSIKYMQTQQLILINIQN